MEDQICEIHNDPALFIEQDAQENQVFLCRFCVQQRLKIKNIDDVYNEEKLALKQLEMNFEQNIKQLKDFAEVLQQLTQQIQQKLEKFKQSVQQSISHITEQKNQVKNISKDYNKLQLNKTNEQKNLMNISIAQIVQQLNNHIKELQISAKLEQLYQSLEENFKLKQQDEIKKIHVIEKKLVQQDDQKKFKVIDKKFDFKLMEKSSHKQNEYCYAIAFNKDATIMIAGCKQLIKVFEFKDDKLKELQQLNGHSDKVFCLCFMKKQNQFISGSLDATMMIWEQNQNYEWVCNQILKSHASSIMCILMDQNKDLLISGSSDKRIKFWSQQNNIWSCNQSIDCESIVYSISLNDQEDELIASVEYKEILVFKLQGEKWKIKQSISVEQLGYRLCFINQNQFLFQPKYSSHLQIFDKVVSDKTYYIGQVVEYQIQDIHDSFSFPIQYVSQIGLIIVKHANYVHIIKRNQNGELKVEQSINFNTHALYGCITDDGRYIATWDNLTYTIQIRKFEF